MIYESISVVFSILYYRYIDYNIFIVNEKLCTINTLKSKHTHTSYVLLLLVTVGFDRCFNRI